MNVDDVEGVVRGLVARAKEDGGTPVSWAYVAGALEVRLEILMRKLVEVLEGGEFDRESAQRHLDLLQAVSREVRS